MRKLFALAFMTLALAVTALGCGQQAQQTQEAPAPPAETSTMQDTSSSMMADTAAAPH